MKHLDEYLAEYLITNIYESKFGSSSWSDHDYKYSKQLIEWILSDNKEDNDKVIIKGHKLSELGEDLSKLQTKIKKLRDVGVENTTQEDFENCFNDNDGELRKILKDKFNIGNGSIFYQLDKSQFTGLGGDAGQSKSEAAEYLVTFLFNFGETVVTELYKKFNNQLKNITNDGLNIIDSCKISDKIKTALKNGISQWEERIGLSSTSSKTSPYLWSSIKSAKLAYDLLKDLSLNKNDYMAMQVNKNTLDEDPINKNEDKKNELVTLSGYLSDASEIAKLCGLEGNEKTIKTVLFGSSKAGKDVWNKGDILLININKNVIDNIKNDLNKKITDNSNHDNDAKEISPDIDKNANITAIVKLFNGCINAQISEKNILPVSLKLIGFDEMGTFSYETSESANDKNTSLVEPVTYDDEIIYILPDHVTPDTYTGNTYIKVKHRLSDTNPKREKVKNGEVTYSLQFRAQSGKSVKNLTVQSGIEYTMSKANSMRMGKGITIIKNKLGLGDGNEYYKNFNDNKHLAKFILNNFDFMVTKNTNVPPEDMKNVNPEDNPKLKKLIDEINGISDPGNVPIYQRTGVKGLFGILTKYFNDKNLDDDISDINKKDMIDCFNLLYKYAALGDDENECKSSWWLIM